MQLPRVIRRGIAAGVIALATALGAAGGAAAQAPGTDSVTGVADPSLGGDFSLRYVFAASSGPSGEQPRGFVLAIGISHLPGFPDRLLSDAPVTCLNVSGDRATIGVDLLNADGGPRFGFARLFVEDLGGAGADRFGLDVVAERDTLCPIEHATTLVQPIEAGDIVVHDAVPVALPAVKAQCGRGGWAQYGFRSRGRCNQFVGLRPKTGSFPTDAAQCRSGGWVQSGFRNERTCVRFVGLIPR